MRCRVWGRKRRTSEGGLGDYEGLSRLNHTVWTVRNEEEQGLFKQERTSSGYRDSPWGDFWDRARTGGWVEERDSSLRQQENA